MHIRYIGPMSLISISELICCLYSFFADKSALLPDVFSRQLSTLQNVSDIYILSLIITWR
jgi:hypothetical protein